MKSDWHKLDKHVLRALVKAEYEGRSLDTAFARACLALDGDRAVMDACKQRLLSANYIEVEVSASGLNDSIVMYVISVTDMGRDALREGGAC